MRTTFLLCMAWVLLGALPADAELRGVTLYERGDYVRARKALEDDLRSAKLSKEERVKARLYLAAALHASGAQDAARSQLEELALTAPSLQVDPILFPPAFVALAEQARKNVEAQRQAVEARRKEEERQAQDAERQRQIREAERQRQEAERLAQEQAAARPKPPPPEPPAVQEPKSVRLSPEVFGFLDPLGKGSIGMGFALTLGLGGWEVNARALTGTEPGFGGEVGVLVGSGSVRPRLALRGTAVPGAHAYGGGAVAGLRLSPMKRLTFLVDVGAEYLKVQDSSKYRSFVLSGSAGAGFDLL
ncbi:hypothetical protein [Hyalangium versicolor]|uniref:hypothetical protein n=1 Tax=Hyalangium versicolor TaxID=2861190 RepID=UPI001CCC4F10|nr:hypothetical protein [Hyalangium versicolor]